MIDEFQIKGLEKLINTSAIKEIYPMIDKIIVRYEDTGASGFGMDLDILDFDIILNDPSTSGVTGTVRFNKSGTASLNVNLIIIGIPN
jgi:hypothetical protein